MEAGIQRVAKSVMAGTLEGDAIRVEIDKLKYEKRNLDA